MMFKNEGEVDRVIRVLVGLAVLTQAFWGLQTPWAYVGIILVGTGLFGYCPLYSFLGIKTFAKSSHQKK